MTIYLKRELHNIRIKQYINFLFIFYDPVLLKHVNSILVAMRMTVKAVPLQAWTGS